MAYSDNMSLVVGDTLPELNLALKDKSTAASGLVLDEENSATWSPIDITGATVTLRIRALGSSALTASLDCTVTSGIGGLCVTDFSNAEGNSIFTVAGNYEGEVEILFASGGRQTVFDLVKFKIREDFD